MKTQKYFQTNSGLGYGELNYFLQINEKQFICIGHLLNENDPCIELGEVVTAATHWEELSEPSRIMKDQFTTCEEPFIQIDQSLLDLIVNQAKEIELLNKKTKRLESEIETLHSRITLPN